MNESEHAHVAEHAHAAGHGGHHHHEPTFVEKYIFPTDHKYIAKQYMLTGLVMAAIAGFFAYAFRMQLAWPGSKVPFYGVVSPTEYNMLVTNHGTVMVFWVAMPVLIAAFGNYLIPLMIGADDMVFPRLNRLSYQLFLLSAIVIAASWSFPAAASAAPGPRTLRCRRARSTASPAPAHRSGWSRWPSSLPPSSWAASTSSPPP